MFRRKFLHVVMATFLLTGVAFISCDDDDDDDNKPSTGNSVFSIENVSTVKDFVQSGTFQMTGTDQPVILPGQSVSFTFHAGKGQSIMFATMYGHSNDIFFAPQNSGIGLFDDDGNAVTGEVSDHMRLWDNGTRRNEAPGPNLNHPGIAEAGTVAMIEENDAYENQFLPASQLMRVTLDYTPSTSEFELTITNISGGSINETPFSPGVWVVSNKSGNGLVNDKPFFTPGTTSSDALTALAEMGNNEPLAKWVTERTGIMTGLSPTIVVIYSGDTNPIYTLNEKDKGMGLKELAQTGNTNPLKESLEKMSNVRKVYIVGDAPIAPGEKKEINFDSFVGYNIAYATMFGYSNDWFYSNSESISSLTKGELTDKTVLLDNGTAVNQYPGAGNNQSIFSGFPELEDNVISRVDYNTYPIPPVSDIIKITLR